MLDKIISGTMKLRLALWLVELSLPDENSLKVRLRSGLVAVIYAVASGLLLALAVGSVIFGLGIALYHYAELSILQAGIVVAATFIIIAVLLLLLCRNHFNNAISTSGKTSSSPLPFTDEIISDLVNGFKEGYRKGAAD